MIETEKTGLLELLSFRTGCMYLSDLRQIRLLPEIQHVVRSISPEKFSLWEWCDAVSYITGEAHSFSSPGEAASYLLNYREKSR